MSTRDDDLEAALFEFTTACEQPPWPGKEWSRSVPTEELLEEWTSRFPQYRDEFVSYAADLIVTDIWDEHAPVPTQEEIDACVEKSWKKIKSMIDKAWEDQGR